MTNKSRVYYILCLFTLAVFLVAYFAKTIQLQRDFIDNGWIMGDWLINYSGGFVRRGVLGEIALWLGSYLKASPQTLILYLKYFLYALFCCAFLLLAIKKRFGLVEIILFLSPWSIIFGLNDPSGSGRKEILLISAFTVFVYLKLLIEDKNIFFKRWDFWYLLITLPFLALSHEGLFFFFQYFFLLPLLSEKKDKHAFYAVAIPYLISAAMVIALGTLFKGNQAVAHEICSSLKNLNIEDKICGGAISSLGGFEFSIHTGYFKIYLPVLALTLTPLMCYGISILKINPITFITIFSIILLPSIPIYILAADWGRWIHISGLLIFIALLANKSTTDLKISGMSPIVIFFICVTSYIYIFNWKIPHWIGAEKNLILVKQDFTGYISNFFIY